VSLEAVPETPEGGVFVVPLGVSELTITVTGSGSSDWECGSNCAAKGGSVTGTFPVLPGASLALVATPQEMCISGGGVGSVTGGGLTVIAGGGGAPAQPPELDGDLPPCTDGGVGGAQNGGGSETYGMLAGGNGGDGYYGGGGGGAVPYCAGALAGNGGSGSSYASPGANVTIESGVSCVASVSITW
jgi:hypothetical protein